MRHFGKQCILACGMWDRSMMLRRPVSASPTVVRVTVVGVSIWHRKVPVRSNRMGDWVS
jgi:hypothetical protein